jgi:hypothetical protein
MAAATKANFRELLIEVMAERGISKHSLEDLTGRELAEAQNTNEGIQQIVDEAVLLHEKFLQEALRKAPAQARNIVAIKPKPAAKEGADKATPPPAAAAAPARKRKSSKTPPPPAPKLTHADIAAELLRRAKADKAAENRKRGKEDSAETDSETAEDSEEEEADSEPQPPAKKAKKAKDPNAPKRVQPFGNFHKAVAAAYNASVKAASAKASAADKSAWTTIRETWDTVQVQIGSLELKGKAQAVFERAEDTAEFLVLKDTEQTMASLLAATQTLLTADQKQKSMSLATVMWSVLNNKNPLPAAEESSTKIVAAADASATDATASATDEATDYGTDDEDDWRRYPTAHPTDSVMWSVLNNKNPLPAAEESSTKIVAAADATASATDEATDYGTDDEDDWRRYPTAHPTDSVVF